MRSAVLALFSLLMAGHLWAQDRIDFPTQPLRIVTASGKIHPFTVELADTSERRSRGLMFRHALAADRGMLFDFAETRRVTMWMSNTFIPLDMLFIKKDGVVATLRQDAVPHSEALIDSGVPVAFVLELPAGTVERLEIAPGDRVEAPAIGGP
ncbi:DUF192 domain-containing protein [Ensifer soli]|uniref:DUF192 domain-containing protein n=1 Tax=Ciceribacter sp. sgz301302 TaxID=3342379 RepID=UPI0035BA46C5